jgi:hypothetical protein
MLLYDGNFEWIFCTINILDLSRNSCKKRNFWPSAWKRPCGSSQNFHLQSEAPKILILTHTPYINWHHLNIYT